MSDEAREPREGAEQESAEREAVEHAKLPDDHPLVKTLNRLRDEIKSERADKAALTERVKAADDSKSEVEKATERIAKLESDLAAARAEAERRSIQAKYAISDDDAELFLTASDRKTLERQAERLAERNEASARKPGISPREGKHPSPKADPLRELTRQVFGPTS